MLNNNDINMIKELFSPKNIIYTYTDKYIGVHYLKYIGENIVINKEGHIKNKYIIIINSGVDDFDKTIQYEIIMADVNLQNFIYHYVEENYANLDSSSKYKKRECIKAFINKDIFNE